MTQQPQDPVSVAMEVRPPTDERLKELEAGRNVLATAARELVINSEESEEQAWAIVNRIAALEKVIAGDFAAAKKAAHEAHRAVIAQEAGHLDRLKEPDRIVRGKLLVWEGEKRRAQAEVERKLREEAEARATEDRRIAQEQAVKEAESGRLEEAAAAEAAGKSAEAEELLAKPVEVAEVPMVAPMIVPTIAPSKVEGAGAMVEVWKFEIEDVCALPGEYVLADEVAIGKVVRALKSKTNIPGVRVYSVLEPRRKGGRRS